MSRRGLALAALVVVFTLALATAAYAVTSTSFSISVGANKTYTTSSAFRVLPKNSAGVRLMTSTKNVPLSFRVVDASSLQPLSNWRSVSPSASTTPVTLWTNPSALTARSVKYQARQAALVQLPTVSATGYWVYNYQYSAF